MQLPSGSTGALCGLFLAACRGEACSTGILLERPTYWQHGLRTAEAASKEIVPQLLAQLASNEARITKASKKPFSGALSFYAVQVIEAKQAAEAVG